MYIDRVKIIEVLRARGLRDRADWVERSLPPLVDVDKNNSLLQTLDIDPATLAPVDDVAPRA